MDLARYQAVFLDLDGTIYKEEHALPGAAELVRKLRSANRKFACLSNSTLSPAQISQRLARMGMEIDPDHIYSAAAAAADYILERYKPRPAVFNLATEGMVELLNGRVDWIERPDQPCHAVVAGAPTNVYATEQRQRIALLLLRAGAHLIGICPDRVFPSPRGLEFGVGAHCALLGYAANVKPIFCGKPQRRFFQGLCEKLHVRPEDCVLIGDNLESDIAGAKHIGMSAILTLTGVARPEDAEALPPAERPDAVVNDLTAFL